MKRNRIAELDFLRSLATLLLLVHHSGIYQYQIGSFPLRNLSKYNNHLLLGAFVFISGYLTARTLSRREIFHLSAFYRSRLLRLYPPYLVALLSFVFLLGIRISSQEMLIHLMGLQVLLSPKYSDPIRTLWFISLLLIFFTFAPTLILSLKRIARLFAAYLTIFMITILIHNSIELLDIRFFYFFPTFAIGSLIGVAQALPVMKTSNSLLGGSLVGFSVGILMLSQNNLTYIPDLDLLHILWSNLFILSSIVIIFRSSHRLTHFRFVQNLILYIATSSYFTYLYHRPLWRILYDISGIGVERIEVLINLVSIPIVIAFAFILQNLYKKIVERI